MTAIRFAQFNFGDWSLSTHNMSNQQKGIFLNLYILYFSNATANNGKIDASDFDMLCWQVACQSDSEIADLRLLLKAKFKKNGNTYRHTEWDKQIKSIQWEIKKGNTGNGTGNELGNDSGNTGKSLSNAERTAKVKAERKKLLNDLGALGVETPVNTPIAELRLLHEKHCGNELGNDSGNDGNNNGNTQGNASNAQKPSNNHKPITNNHKLNNISPPNPQGACVGVGENEVNDETNQTQTTKTHPSSDTHKTLNVSFETFWDSYDKKIDPKKCKPLWERLSEQDRLDIMAYIPKYKQAQPDKQYRKNPQTFLNARSWESEIVSSQPTKSSPDKFYGTPADPLAVNQKHFPTPPNWKENLEKAMAMGSNPIGLTEI